MRTCARCQEVDHSSRLFCPDCGKIFDLDELRQVRIPGFVGPQHSKSPKVQAFLETGDPAHLD